MIAVDFGVTISEAGLLVTLFALAAAIFAPILIALTINVDRKSCLWLPLVCSLLVTDSCLSPLLLSTH